MIALTIGLALIVAVAAIAYVIAPLRKPGATIPDPREDELTELLARKDAILRAIKEAEFDFQTGKLSEEDFQRYDTRLRRQAVALMQQIDKFTPAGGQIDDDIEAEIASLRQQTPQPVEPMKPTPQPAPATNGSDKKVPRFCRECGAAVEADDKFCSECGTPLRTTEVTA